MRVDPAGGGAVAPQPVVRPVARPRPRANRAAELRRKLQRIEVTVKLLTAGKTVGENIDIEA